MSQIKLPTIIALLILIIGLGLGVILVQSQQIFKIGASPESAPQNVRITNISDTSFTVSWTTDSTSIGSLLWGENKNPSTPKSSDITPSNLHSIKVEELTPQKTYYFKIISADKTYDNSGIPWSTQTAASSTSQPSSLLASGSVISANGQPVSNALVFLNSPSINSLSTITSNQGTFVLPIGQARNSSLTDFAKITESTNFELLITTSDHQITTAQFNGSQVESIPQITIGQNNDFRNLPTTSANSSSLPRSQVSLPVEETTIQRSKFEIPENIDEIISASTDTTITLDSISQNEIITTTSPEFFGDGPKGTVITIKVESNNPQTEQITIGSSGAWQYSPPEDLEEGSHTITISWTDATTGILHTLTRNFTVLAADDPSFESTPSATLSPTLSPTNTPTPTITPTSTPKATPTQTPVSTTSPVLPNSGNTAPTNILIISGILLIVTSSIFSLNLITKNER